jgi:hypothetical protein
MLRLSWISMLLSMIRSPSKLKWNWQAVVCLSLSNVSKVRAFQSTQTEDLIDAQIDGLAAHRVVTAQRAENVHKSRLGQIIAALRQMHGNRNATVAPGVAPVAPAGAPSILQQYVQRQR